MSRTLLVSIFCEDRVGLVSGVTGLLFDQGANLADVNFAVLGRAAEFSAVCDVAGDLDQWALHGLLAALPVLKGAEIKVSPFDDQAGRDLRGRITHRIEISGGDQPGLIARLSEIFAGFEANVVELDAHTVAANRGGDRYVMRFAVWLPAERADVCLSAVANTAESLGLSCRAVAEDDAAG